MRGTLEVGSVRVGLGGIIPAYAGNTLGASARRRRPKDHPRVCGEHEMRLMVCFIPRGSSPRMRGTRISETLLLCRNGIIPAYAGNTIARGISAHAGRDHPRVCGEHCCSCWGWCSRSWIIPAYAGNTFVTHCSSFLRWDHPRVCGEHVAVLQSDFACLGSSPRMRGTLTGCPHLAQVCGIIPTYAGNT